MANKTKRNVIEAAATEITGVTADETELRPRKYSKRLRRAQEVEHSVTKAIHRLVRSVDVGITEWREERDRSSRKRRDGAVRDALENFAKATGKSIREVSRAPEDAVRIVRRLKIGRIVRRIPLI